MNVVFMFYVLFIFFISTNVNVGNKKNTVRLFKT